MGSKAPEVQETPQQRVMVERAQEQMADYKRRWLPLQQNMAKQIEGLAAPNAPARLRAEGRAETETEAKFQQAQGAVEKSLSNSGAGPGSSRFNLGVSNMANDEATSKGMGMLASDNAINEAYTQGLGALTALGRGEKASALQGTANIAAMSGQQAAQDAMMSAQDAQGNAQLIGQVAGYGLRSSWSPSSVGIGSPNTPSPGALGYGVGAQLPNSGGLVP